MPRIHTTKRRPSPRPDAPLGTVGLLGLRCWFRPLLHEVVPNAKVMAVLMNPAGPNAATNARDLPAAARALGLELHLLYASKEETSKRPSQRFPACRQGGS